MKRNCSKSSVRFDANRCELDSHADTVVAGSNFVMLEDTGKSVTVSGFTSQVGEVKSIPVATCATLYTCPSTGIGYTLVCHQSLYFGDKLSGNPSLLNPNQLRLNGIGVFDTPKQFDSGSSHSIVAGDLTIPLDLQGVCSGFESRKPTDRELEECPRIDLTSDLEWEPGSDFLARREADAITRNGYYVKASAQKAESDDSDSDQETIRASNKAKEATDVFPELQNPLVAAYNQQRLIQSVKSYQSYDTIDAWDLLGEQVSTVKQLPERVVASVQLTQPEVGDRVVLPVSTGQPKFKLTAEELTRKWGCGLAVAQQTLKVTTQRGIRNILSPGERRVHYKSNHLNFPTLNEVFYSDTAKAKFKSARQFKYAQIWTNGKGYDRFHPLLAKSDAFHSLTTFLNEDGIPKQIITDGAKELHLAEWGKICKKMSIYQSATIPYSPWQNKAESSVRELKKKVRTMMRKTGSPKRLWCYCGELAAALRRLTASQQFDLQGRTPYEHVHGSTPDISAYALFSWYEPVFYLDPASSFPEEKKDVGLWLGIEESCVDIMAHRILNVNGEVVVRKSVWALSPDDLALPAIQEKITDVKETAMRKCGDQLSDDQIPNGRNMRIMEPPEGLFEEEDLLDEPEQPELCARDIEDIEEEYGSFDQYLLASVSIPRRGLMARAEVKSRRMDNNGNRVGLSNPNPMLDTAEYELQFEDGSTDFYTANMIAENIMSQVDAQGRNVSIFKEISDHRKTDEAMPMEQGTFKDKNGRTQLKRTTKGWEFNLTWNDDSTSWIPLKDAKEANPVEVAEYVVANKLQDEPAFAWWVPHVLRKRDRIISKVKTKYWSKTHKFGVRMPKSVKEALEIDKASGTDFWRKAIDKEMKNVMVAFNYVETGDLDKDSQFIECHMIFDVKMDLTRKARFVAGGHKTAAPPKESTFSTVVSRDSLRILFTVAALNGLDVLCADVQNAYLCAPTTENLHTTCGLEFGTDNVGRTVKIVRALYGLRSSGKSFHDHLAQVLRDLGFESSKGDPDVWMRKANKPNGDKIWEYVLVYVDDLLCISHDPRAVMDGIAKTYTFKGGAAEEPTAYLGADIGKYEPEGPDTPSKWYMSSDTYVKRAVEDVERELPENQKLIGKASTPMSQGYHPEADGSPLLDDKRLNYYQTLIGVMRWICELGRIDIVYDCSKLSRYLAAPREGHLEQVLHVFAYLKRHPRSKIVFDDFEPPLAGLGYAAHDWSELYPGAAEVLPNNLPEARGKPVMTTCFVDADHAGCLATRRSQTGILIFLQNAPVMWYSKRQNTVESSTFGSEFVAARIAVEMIEGLRYKLRMFGLPVDGPTNMFCDNQSVVINATRPESTLKKKHCAVAYHRCRESQAAGVTQWCHEPGETNLADILTKGLPGPRLHTLLEYIVR